MQNNDLNPVNISTWTLNEKTTIVWLASVNKYILADFHLAKLIELIVMDDSLEAAVQYCTHQLHVEKEQALAYITDVQQNLNAFLQNQATQQLDFVNAQISNAVFSTRYYSIYGVGFKVDYGNSEYEELLNPKFAHQEVEVIESPAHHFQVKSIDQCALLLVDEQPIGAWEHEDNHFLGGKFSMQVLQKIYKNEENDWMAVFHAAAVTDGHQCLMFLGDSGNGKSTLSALLLASGLEVLADDFLPVDANSQFVCHFPSAISIKNKAYELLSPVFPQLNHLPEISNTALGKVFRYLPPKRNSPLCVPCKALVFVKYEQSTGFQLEEMSKEEAFEQLVPDSWISATPENANRFVNWFKQLPCFRLTYSDNEKMVATVKNWFENDL
jgi:hypothetical protein